MEPLYILNLIQAVYWKCITHIKSLTFILKGTLYLSLNLRNRGHAKYSYTNYIFHNFNTNSERPEDCIRFVVCEYVHLKVTSYHKAQEYMNRSMVIHDATKTRRSGPRYTSTIQRRYALLVCHSLTEYAVGLIVEGSVTSIVMFPCVSRQRVLRRGAGFLVPHDMECRNHAERLVLCRRSLFSIDYIS